MDESDESSQTEFEQHAQQADLGFMREFVLFLRDNKKWWLVPLIGALLSIGLISVLASSGAAPFIYTLF